jgi:hypothetical protein
MREHQIVITLKPDQFLEVQRLARAANAKSMGAFVRQKLLAALGIEGALTEEQPAQAPVVAQDVDVEAILGDLKRVHSELKAFVAESLSPYSPEAFGQAAVENELESSAPQVVASSDEKQYSEPEAVEQDELEKLADRTFAISPRLGPIGDPAPQRTNNEENRILLSRHEVHTRHDAHRYHAPTPPLEAMEESFTDDEPVQPIAADAMDDFFSNAPVIKAPPAVPYRPAAPSSGSVPHAVDPLSKLLSEEDMKARSIPKSVPIDDDDDAFDVPLSIAERRRMLTDSDEAPVYREPPHPALQPTLPSELPEETPQPASAAAPIANEVSSSAPEEILPAETSTTTASSPIPPVPGEPGPPLGYPPLSGSPPPKRRQV